MSTLGAYGAGMAGRTFDPLAYIKKRQVLIRILCAVMSVVVFGCISTGGWMTLPGSTEEVCQVNGDNFACRFSVFIGVCAFLGCIIFLIIDALFDHFSNIKHRKYAVLSDMVFSGALTVLWFLSFCYLSVSWLSTTKTTKTPQGKDYPDSGDIIAAIIFSLLSIPCWGYLTFIALQRYKEGVSAEFSTMGGGFEDIAGGPADGYYPDLGASDSYQTQPFANTSAMGGNDHYQGATY